MVAVRRAPSWCAGFCGIYRSTNLRAAATLSFSSDQVVAPLEILYMFKITPNPPLHDAKLNLAAHRAIDHYLTPPTAPAPEPSTLFTVTSGASSESLIANSYETLSSVTTLLLDLSEDLTGKDRDRTLAIHQLSELGVLLMSTLMDQQTPHN